MEALITGPPSARKVLAQGQRLESHCRHCAKSECEGGEPAAGSSKTLGSAPILQAIGPVVAS